MLASVTAAAAVVVAVLAAAPTGRARADGDTGAAVAAAAFPDVAGLLRDAWVSDGAQGYFVDNPLGAQQPVFDLYQTRWELEAHPVRLDGAAVTAWTADALLGQAPSTGLPAIAQIQYAVRIRQLAGVPVSGAERQAVQQALGRLHGGGGYASGAGEQPDLGSTAEALQILGAVGLPVPAGIELPAAGATLSLSEALSVVEIRAALGQDVRTAAAQLEAALAKTTPDALWLSAQYALRQLPGSGGLPSLADGACGNAVSRDGAVSLPGQHGSDPQATFYAVRLGCAGARESAAAPHSRAGWPTAQAAAGSAAASLAALRLAGDAGLTTQYAAPLRRELAAVWLPAAVSATGDGTDAVVRRLDVRLLGVGLGVELHGLPVPDGVVPENPAARLPALEEVSLAPSAAARQRLRQAVAQDRTAAPSMADAVWLELAAGVLGDADLGHRARQEAGRLCSAAGSSRRCAESSGGAASLSATALGLWILRPVGATAAEPGWTAAGMAAQALPLATLVLLDELRLGQYGGPLPLLF